MDRHVLAPLLRFHLPFPLGRDASVERSSASRSYREPLGLDLLGSAKSRVLFQKALRSLALAEGVEDLLHSVGVGYHVFGWLFL